jgi:predicted nucleotidyltransferase
MASAQLSARDGQRQRDALEMLGLAPASARILRYFAVRPQAQPHARELQRLLRLGGGSLQRELGRLEALGAIERVPDGRRVRYRTMDGSAVWTAVRILEGATDDPVPLIEDALVDVPGIQAAFVFGSVGAGTQRPDSDVDLFVVEGPMIDKRKLLTQLSEVATIVGREVNAVRYTLRDLGERLGDPSHPAYAFVRDALLGAKRWVAGEPDIVSPIADAARLPPAGATP